jgi:hypothetical protein
MKYEISKSAISQAVKLEELQEDELYEMLGEALIAQEILTEIPEKYVKMRGLETSLTSLTKVEKREKGKRFFEKIRKKLFNAICVEGKACKWEKDILGDAKSLLEILIPIIAAVIGTAIPAGMFAVPPLVVITIALIIIKWGIRIFCRCS